MEKTTKSVICNPHPLFFGWSNREEWDGWSM